MGMMSVFVGAMVGGCFGVIITSLAVAAKRADEQNGVYEIEKRCVPEPASPVSSERIQTVSCCLPFPMGLVWI